MIERDINIDSEQLYLNDSNDQFKGEIELWRAVIIKALDDLSLPLTNKRYRIWQKQAYRWFIQEQYEFLAVCEYANISPEYILGIANKILDKKL